MLPAGKMDELAVRRMETLGLPRLQLSMGMATYTIMTPPDDPSNPETACNSVVNASSAAFVECPERGPKAERLAASIFRPDYPHERTSLMRFDTSDLCRLCCKSLKTPGDKFPAKSRSKPRSLIGMASGSLPRSLVSSSLSDEVPHSECIRRNGVCGHRIYVPSYLRCISSTR